jgi:hypothetical protein
VGQYVLNLIWPSAVPPIFVNETLLNGTEVAYINGSKLIQNVATLLWALPQLWLSPMSIGESGAVNLSVLNYSTVQAAILPRPSGAGDVVAFGRDNGTVPLLDENLTYGTDI